MRTLTTTLKTEQQKQSAKTPYVSAIISDQPCEIARWAWSSIYYTSGDEDLDHAIGILNSGPIIRARRTSNGRLMVQKITDPTVASQWSTWTQLEAPGTLAAVPIAVHCATGSDLVRIYYVGSTSKIVYNRESSDGVTYSAAEVVYNEATAGYTIQAVTGASRGGGNFCYYALNKGGASPDTWLVAIRKSGGAWVGRSEHTQARYTVLSLSNDRDANGYSYIAVCDGSPARISFQEYDEVFLSWAGGTVLSDVSAGANFVFQAVQFIHSSSVHERHVYSYVENSGAAPAFVRPMIGLTPARYVLTETVPFSPSSSYGYKIVRTSATWYLSNAQRAYSSPVYSGSSGERLDVSADVLKFELTTARPNHPTRALLTLQNAASTYATAGAAGAYKCLREGAQVGVSLGYVTPSGNEGIWQEPLWIDRVAFLDAAGEGTVELELIDCWEILSRLRVKRQVTFTSATIATVLNQITDRVSATQIAATGRLAVVLPSFTWQPGQSFADIARSLIDLTDATLRFVNGQVTDGVGWTSAVVSIPTRGSGASIYSYGPASHPTLSERHVSGGQRVGQVEVFGSGSYYGYSLDYTYLNTIWRHIIRKVIAKVTNTQTDVNNRAADELVAVQIAASDGWMLGPANVAQEVGDVIDVTYARANLSATKRTVTARAQVFERKKFHRLEQRLGLGAAQ